jgi:hypothetical protein
MDPKITQLLNEIVRLANHLAREMAETEEYVRKGDKHNALRNTNDSRDELQTLTNKWQQVTQLLSK